ncbi:poly-gamma-glutamate hydrolase family protein [Haloarcula sp. S1AR25-5A]|uniref:Poly-gamma-glutamate hydrolase family protein n=1 Tax=Haloarcula terrestris TaxID=2950533 RepID=A0AAE4EZV5_9EURY|nr:poly-gamma-glutamate hydrolase family protein [Haloarcula terrestris]MDS0222494.1 poly-gamma-glutamate hydrolase family protein [Haloarcula terrestris]
MRKITRRTVLTGVGSVALGTGAVITNAKSNNGSTSDDTTVRIKKDDSIATSERCRLPQATIDAAGLEPGHQVRLSYDGAPAVFTVDSSDDKFGYVSSGGRDRLGVSGGSFEVNIDPMVVDPSLDEKTAAEEGGFLEGLTDHGTSDLIALAPHGGYIEWGTDSQARHISDQLEATAWYSAGWWPGGGAYRRWHVTSTDIHPRSFPVLDDISDRGFDYAVSFHGWSESHVAVGGGAPDGLREDIRDGISDIVDCEVRLASEGPRDGDSPENIVNWLTASGSDGVQIEQPWSVRENHTIGVADTVVDIFNE